MEQQPSSEGRSRKEEEESAWSSRMRRMKALLGLLLSMLMKVMCRAAIDYLVTRFTGENGGETEMDQTTKDEGQGGEPREGR